MLRFRALDLPPPSPSSSRTQGLSRPSHFQVTAASFAAGSFADSLSPVRSPLLVLPLSSHQEQKGPWGKWMAVRMVFPYLGSQFT